MSRRSRRLPKASDLVVSALRDRIINQQLPVGSRLPSETELMEELDIGRVTVREGLRLLERDGLLEVRRGTAGGNFVSHPDIEQVSESISVLMGIRGTRLREFVEFRLLVEPEAAALAAARRQPEHEEILAHIEEGDHELAHVPDLHLLIARATGNGVLAIALNSLHHPFSEHFRPTRIGHAEMDVTSAAHAKIARMVRTGDADGARDAMQVHLDAYREWLDGEGLLDEPIIARESWGVSGLRR